MCDVVFLDLESTIIEDGCPSIMINIDKLQAILKGRKVIIFSYMIETTNDPIFKDLNTLFKRIESTFKCEIVEHIFLNDVVKSIQTLTAIKFDPNEISSLGKEFALQTLIRLDDINTRFKNALFIDDRIVHGMEFKIFGKYVKCINVDRIRIKSV